MIRSRWWPLVPVTSVALVAVEVRTAEGIIEAEVPE